MNFLCTVNLITNFNTAFMRKLLGTLVLCLLCAFYVEGQTVFGNVRDSNGEGLPGASLIVIDNLPLFYFMN